jgi:GTPase-associated adaptor domain/Calcineurin-like phosphoesterase
MLLLHISDIHFREPDCLHPDTDPDRVYRTLMLQEIRRSTESLGRVGAILVGGDIAFKGDPKEYDCALKWLRELSTACGCHFERIFVVPGNHDVDRRVIVRSTSVRNAQRAIATAEPHRRERELREQFADPETGRALLLPLSAYNDFAKLFNCQVYSPDRLFWRQDLSLDGGITLRMHGLTSVLLSGQEGRDDTRSSLYLSPLQTVLEPADDVVHLVLIHHPTDWLMDHDDADDLISNRAVLHLFGHKHRQRIVREQNYVRYSAGAVNPDRNEAGWSPGYNLIQLDVEGSGVDRMLMVWSHLMQYQAHPEAFRPIQTRQLTDVFCDRFNIPGRTLSVPPFGPTSAATERSQPVTDVPDAEASMSDEPTRNLVYRFWNLTMSQRREVALALGLIDASELALPEPERYGRALIRAGERKLLEQLALEVAKRERH